jgi:UDP-glucose 4-epimerase
MKEMRTVLITGGIGYIGSHTAVLLLQRDYRVIILDNLHNCKLNVLQKIRSITLREPIFFEGDVRDCYLLNKIFQEYSVDSVIHFAGLKAVAESQADPLKYYDYNVSGSISLFKAMLNANVHQLVFSSSATVYGAPDTPQYAEDLPTNPINVYGKTKLMVEKIIHDLSHANSQFKAACLRYFNPVGAHPSGLIGEDPLGTPNNLMPYIGQVALGKLSYLKIYGKDYSTPDGTGMRDYIHVEDLASGHLTALDYIEQNPGVLTVNLGNEKPHSVLEVVRAFEEVSGLQIPYQFTERRAGDLPIYYANAQLAKNVLGWSSRHDLQRMCEDTWRFYKNSGSAS